MSAIRSFSFKNNHLRTFVTKNRNTLFKSLNSEFLLLKMQTINVQKTHTRMHTRVCCVLSPDNYNYVISASFFITKRKVQHFCSRQRNFTHFFKSSASDVKRLCLLRDLFLVCFKTTAIKGYFKA